MRQTKVLRRGQPAVLRTNHARTRLLVRREQATGFLFGGTIVNDENLEVRERLREHALDRFVEKSAEVVAGNDDGDARG